MRTKRAAEAEQLLRGAAQQQPDDLGPAQRARLRAAAQTKRLPEAEAESKKVLKADERNVRAMQLLAQVYYRQGKYELCRLVLENARAVDPKDAVTHNALGTVLLKLKQRTAGPGSLQAGRLAPPGLRRGPQQLRRDAERERRTTTAR